MRIAYFLSAFPNTSETFVLHQIVGAVQKGHEVEIHAYHVAGHVEHPLLKAYNLLDHVQYRPPVPANKLLRLFKACFLMLGLFVVDTRRCVGIFSLLKETSLNEWLELFFLAWSLRGGKNYDVIHAHFGSNGLMAVRLRQAGFLQGKMVTSFHGFDANVVPNALGKNYYQRLFSQGDAFVVSSNFIQQKLLNLGCDAKKTHRIPVGIDVEMWTFKARKGWLHVAPVVLSVGRLVEVKGFTYGIAAMAKVRMVFPDVQYHIVGEGPLHSVLEKQLMDLDLQDCVQFLGKKNQTELNVMYQQSDLFVMPSVQASDGAEEGQGMVLFEAQAAGLPVVATCSGGIAESLPEDALLVAEKNSDALADRMVEQLQALQAQGYDGDQGRLFVQQHFEVSQLNQKLLDFYEALA